MLWFSKAFYYHVEHQASIDFLLSVREGADYFVIWAHTDANLTQARSVLAAVGEVEFLELNSKLRVTEGELLLLVNALVDRSPVACLEVFLPSFSVPFPTPFPPFSNTGIISYALR